MTLLQANNISLSQGAATLVNHVQLQIAAGELVVVLGPNGSGKTSLLRCLAGVLTPQSGTILMQGENIARYDAATRARMLSYLPQSRPVLWPNRVEDIVALGRYPYGGGMGQMGAQDQSIISQCLARCELSEMRHRAMTSLSGGEQARVHMARIFAAQTPLILADEPITALDPRHQYKIMDVLASYVAQGGAALIVLHDVALAARYASRLVWLKQGQVVADGPVTQTLSEPILKKVYDMEARVSLSSSPPEVQFIAVPPKTN
ncbi:MAG: ABC transporter ATP-binding protein [Parvibaculales bacterium]